MAAWPCKINYHHTTRGWDTQFIEYDIYCLVLMKHQVNIVWNILPLGSCQLYCTCRKKKQSEKETYLHLVFVWPEEGLGGKSHCVFDCWTNIITFNKEIERILDFGYL